MGYRSDVLLVLSAEGVRALGKYMDALDKDSPDTGAKLRDYFGSADVFQHDKYGNVMYMWQGVKWYSHDPEYTGPHYIDQFIYESQDLCADDCLFLRLGDEYRDLETIGEMWSNSFDAGLSRKITYRTVEV